VSGAGPRMGRPFWSRGRACTFLVFLFVVAGEPAAFLLRDQGDPGVLQFVGTRSGYRRAVIGDILLCGEMIEEFCRQRS
jgi:hypothetical protein